MVPDQELYDLALALVQRLSQPTLNGTVHFDSDVQGLPGYIIQQDVHVIRPHDFRPTTIDNAETCPACYYRFNVEPEVEAQRMEEYQKWREETFGKRN